MNHDASACLLHGKEIKFAGHNERYTDIKFDEDHFERVIHHEVFHIINDGFKYLFNETEWKKFNKTNFKYAKCSTCTDKLGLDTYEKTDGFFTEYSKSTASEDMAEVFSHLITNKHKNENDIIIKNKRNAFCSIESSYFLFFPFGCPVN